MSPEVTAVSADPIIFQLGLGAFVIGGLVYAVYNMILAYRKQR